MRDFRELHVWRAAHLLTLHVYRATATFPASERYGLASQLRRSAASIGANIAEGCGRGTDADARRCFQIAFGSACEVSNHALLARDLDFLDPEAHRVIEHEVEPVRRMLSGLISKLRARSREETARSGRPRHGRPCRPDG